jgi:Contractile injection system tube protein
MENQVNKLRILKIKNPAEYFKGGGFGDIAKGIAGVISQAATSLFEVQVNPESVRRSFSVMYHHSRDINNSRNNPQIYRPRPESLDLKFILDGTGALQQTSIVQEAGFAALDVGGAVFGAIGIDAMAAYVATRVAQLQATIYDYIDETHRTPLLAVNWGKLVFIGVLEDMAVNYNLFAPSGIPLRAEINLKIKAHDFSAGGSALGAAANAVLSFLSPDLSRRRVVRESDNVLTLCREVYESDKYYIEVAKANGITNFRKVRTGEALDFPPIEKRRVV